MVGRKNVQMKSKLVLLFCVFGLVLTSRGQSDQVGLWNSITKLEDNRYIINMPEGWKKVELAVTSGFDYKYDFQGVGLPSMVYGSPLYANFTVSRMSGNKPGQAMDQVINDFTVFYDRVTEPGYNYDTTSASIQTGQTGTMLHTRYYRRSNVSNYSKYYLIFYSIKTNETYTLTVNFQYKDANYDTERSAHMTEYAKQIFAHFELR